MPKRLTESGALVTREADSDKAGRLLVQLISPGWGSSGYYSPKVLENAATAKVFPAGTHMFFDHPSESERHDRPERSVRDLASVLTEDARWDTDLGALVAETQVIGPYRDLLTDDTFIENVGTSIVAYADTTVGEAEGRKGTIITELVESQSVDYVTRAGRGGRVLAVLESARANVDEAATRDTRDRLERALGHVYPPTESNYARVWVVDFDPEAATVYYRLDGDGMFAQGYRLTADGVDLTGDPMEVRQVATYVPATGDMSVPTARDDTTSPDSDIEESHQPPAIPAGSTHTHESFQEEHMGTTQIEESRLARLEADAGRVQTLETERDAARTERDDAHQGRLAAENRGAAIEMIADFREHDFTALERRGLLADLPTVEESGELDRDKFATALSEAATEASRSRGGVRGFGTVDESGGPSYDDYEAGFHVGQKGA